MPKPVKKSAKTKKKRTTPKRPSSDPNRRAHQMMAEHMARAASATPPWPADDATLTPPQGDTFEAQLSAHMAKLGAKGGKISGAKRMENLSGKQRKDIARRAALARWAKQGQDM